MKNKTILISANWRHLFIFRLANRWRRRFINSPHEKVWVFLPLFDALRVSFVVRRLFFDFSYLFAPCGRLCFHWNVARSFCFHWEFPNWQHRIDWSGCEHEQFVVAFQSSMLSFFCKIINSISSALCHWAEPRRISGILQIDHENVVFPTRKYIFQDENFQNESRKLKHTHTKRFPFFFLLFNPRRGDFVRLENVFTVSTGFLTDEANVIYLLKYFDGTNFMYVRFLLLSLARLHFFLFVISAVWKC